VSLWSSAPRIIPDPLSLPSRLATWITYSQYVARPDPLKPMTSRAKHEPVAALVEALLIERAGYARYSRSPRGTLPDFGHVPSVVARPQPPRLIAGLSRLVWHSGHGSQATTGCDTSAQHSPTLHQDIGGVMSW
jgi:hypothetical protein